MLQKKQLLFLAIGIGVLLFVIIVSLLTSGSSQQAQSEQTSTPSESASDAPSDTGNGTRGSSSDSNQGNQQQAQTWKKYTAGKVEISYPPDWAVEDKIADSIGVVTISQQSQYYNPSAPSVSIVSYLQPTESLSARIANIAGTGYSKKTTTTVSGIPATDLLLSLPAPIVNGQTYGGSINQHDIFLEKENIQYMMVTKAQAGTSDEKTVSQIRNTVSVF